MSETILIAAALLGAVWLVRRGLSDPQPATLRQPGAPRCGGCSGCKQSPTCERDAR